MSEAFRSEVLNYLVDSKSPRVASQPVDDVPGDNIPPDPHAKAGYAGLKEKLL